MENRIRELRIEKGMSQEELASKVKIGRTYLSHIENGHYNPSVGIASRIARELRTTIDALFLSEVCDKSHKERDSTGTEDR